MFSQPVLCLSSFFNQKTSHILRDVLFMGLGCGFRLIKSNRIALMQFESFNTVET